MVQIDVKMRKLTLLGEEESKLYSDGRGKRIETYHKR